MNQRVIKSLIVLMWTILGLFVFAKLVFPAQFIAVATHPKVLLIGSFIDEHLWAELFANSTISLLGAHFYLSSCKQRWNLRWYQYLILAVYFVLINMCYMWNTRVASLLDTSVIVIVPFLLGSRLSQTVSIFVLHHIGQIVLLLIRSVPFYFVETNYATRFLLLFDANIWLVIYYLYSNLCKEETLWEWASSSFLAICRKLSSKRNLRK